MNMTAVFMGRTATLEKAKKALEAVGICCRITRPRRKEGTLKVSAADAERARNLLGGAFCGTVISAAEAAWFKCHACGASLSEGQWRCPKCQAIVGDPHGR